MKRSILTKMLVVALTIGALWTGEPVLMSSNAEEIIETTEGIGSVTAAENLLQLNVKGKTIYSEAFAYVSEINKLRVAEGLEPLVMDAELLNAATTHAQELAIWYDDHECRPNGEKVNSLCTKIAKSFAVMGVTTTANTLESNLEQSEVKAVLMDPSYKSIGVGCFGQPITLGEQQVPFGYWSVMFSTETGTAASQKEDVQETVSIAVKPDNLTISLNETKGTLEEGSTLQLLVNATQVIEEGSPESDSHFTMSLTKDAQPNSYTWSSADEAVATVDTDGLITAKEPGETVITGINKGYADAKLTFHITVTECNPFADVPLDFWGYPYAKYAYENGIMKGKDVDDNGKIILAPTDNITRAEFVQILYNAEGKPDVTYSDKFTDVKSADWYAKAVIWAANNNIVAGKGDKFDAASPITRQEIAVILYKYATNYKKLDTTQRTNFEGFNDSNRIDPWAQTAMQWAVAKNVMKGAGSNLNPTANAWRVEAVTMYKNLQDAY